MGVDRPAVQHKYGEARRAKSEWSARSWGIRRYSSPSAASTKGREKENVEERQNNEQKFHFRSSSQNPFESFDSEIKTRTKEVNDRARIDP